MKSILFCSQWGRLAATIAFAMVLSACSKPEPPPEPIRAVKVITVGLQLSQTALEYAGQVQARVESRLGFRVGGKLLARPVELGQRVQAGQVLAQLDPLDLKLANDASLAQVSAARTNRDLAAADFKRYQDLRAQNFISSADLERREATLKSAQAQLDQAQAQLSAQGNQAAYAVLRADAAGVVTAVLAERGQVVSAGTPIVNVAQDGPREVAFVVPEDKVAAIKLGSAVTVRAWSSGAVLKGVVREVAASADPVTRTFSVKLALGAKDSLPLGSTVSVMPEALSHVGQPVLRLPTSALMQDGQSTVVWVLNPSSMTVNTKPVQIATADGNEVVIASGLALGEQVVVAGVHVLAPNQKVSLYKENRPVSLSSKSQTAPESVAASGSASAAAAAASAARK
jgi:RND family efflux transporter MFP subunit